MKLRNVLFLIMSLFCLVPFGQDTIQTITTTSGESSFSVLIFGDGITFEMFIVFLLFGLVGTITSVLLDVYSSGTSMKKFSLKYWWSGNKVRALLSLLILVVGIIFSEQLLSIKMSNWASFLVGLTSDKIIENLLQRKRRKKQDNTTNTEAK